jgi:alkylhydroperoxidase/carboxymuconolactone decarboxylase family protein YurZ
MYDMALLKNLRKLGTLAPTAWPAFQAFDRAAMADGAVPVKYKELMAVAAALRAGGAIAHGAHCLKDD